MKTILCMLVFSTMAFSQGGTAPRFELFGGASYLPSDSMDFPRENSFGFQTNVTGNINRWFGITGDFGGQYGKGPTSVYEYFVGPRFTKRLSRSSVFFNVLIGSAAGHTNRPGFSDQELAFGGGGGFDFQISRRISIRPLQVDYIGSFVDILEDNLRFGSGIVFTFGGK